MDRVMARTPDTSNRFVLEAFDRSMSCAIAQAPFNVTDVDAIRTILGLTAEDDPKLEYLYYLDDEEIAAIVSAFDTFDPRQIDDVEIAIRLYRLPGTIIDSRHGGIWKVPGHQIPELNKHLKGAIVVVARSAVRKL
jgi:hypothetical protein